MGSPARRRARFAIIVGLEADVAVLSVDGDVEQIAKAGLLTHDWRQAPHRGMATASVVALGVRKGNPKGIKPWEDLAHPGIEVLYPNPKTSGGAMWDIIAIYGAVMRRHPERSSASGSEANASTLLKQV